MFNGPDRLDPKVLGKSASRKGCDVGRCGPAANLDCGVAAVAPWNLDKVIKTSDWCVGPVLPELQQALFRNFDYQFCDMPNRFDTCGLLGSSLRHSFEEPLNLFNTFADLRNPPL